MKRSPNVCFNCVVRYLHGVGPKLDFIFIQWFFLESTFIDNLMASFAFGIPNCHCTNVCFALDFFEA